MENPKILTGLGAALHVDANTRPFGFLFHELRMRGVEPIDPEDAHITLVDAFETKFEVNTLKDQDALFDAQDEAVAYLERVAEKGWVVSPVTPEVRKLRHSNRRVGMYIAEIDFLQEIRSEVLECFAKASHGRVRPRMKWSFEPHLTVGTRGNDHYKLARAFSPEQQKRVPVPQEIHIKDSMDVTEKPFEFERGEAVAPICGAMRFRNVPAIVRRAI